MSYDVIARRWARAVFEIGKEAGEVGELQRLSSDIGAFAETFSRHAELAAVLDDPLVPEAEREAVVSEIADRMGLLPAAKGTLRLLARKRRLVVIPDIARQLARLVDEDGNVVRAEVTSAGPLGDDYLAKLRAELEKATGKKVTISHKQDRALIGGVVTRIGDQVIDGSVRTRLAAFRESLLRS
jgi:F-type H+-transporting ATPase subunit delta